MSFAKKKNQDNHERHRNAKQSEPDDDGDGEDAATDRDMDRLEEAKTALLSRSNERDFGAETSGDERATDGEEIPEHAKTITIAEPPRKAKTDHVRPSGYSSDTTQGGWIVRDRRESEDEEDDAHGVIKARRRLHGMHHMKRADRTYLRSKARMERKRGKRLTKIYSVTSHCISNSFHFPSLRKHLKAQGYRTKQYTDVIHVMEENTDIFLFLYGCVVFWNAPESVEQDFLLLLKPFVINIEDNPEFDDFDFIYGEGEEFAISSDRITLGTKTPLERLSVSFALAHSVKLSVFEEGIDKQIELNKQLPLDLARYGEISLTSKEISKKIGQLFMERNEVNLHSDILEDPEFFWENDKYLPNFRKMARYLEMEKRVQVLNARLDVMRELLDMLKTEEQNRHDSRLEWIIIWLILIEVVIEVFWNILVRDVLKLV